MTKKRVVVGLSGGVDSSVAAYLLQQEGYEVIGIFMRNWHDESVVLNNECPWIDDSNDAMLVAEKLGIPFQVLDLSDEYRRRIVEYMFAEYQAGRTPNPDVLCNREIKFDSFLKAALNLGADFVATGHYCRKSTHIDKQGKEVHHLLMGLDPNKDQSYFLCQLSQDQLSKALFPIGHLQKSEVRQIAAEQNLVTANKKDSQGLCFVGKISLPDFLQQQLAPKTGNIIEIPADGFEPSNNEDSLNLIEATRSRVFSPDMGQIKGQHQGAHFYTIGQRKGLGVGGSKEPLFIVGTDVQSNTIYVGQGEKHPALYRKGLKIKADEVHWIQPALRLADGESARYQVRIRYRQALEEADLHCINGDLYIIFDQAQRGVAAGQFAAWYFGDELVGSGVIGG